MIDLLEWFEFNKLVSFNIFYLFKFFWFDLLLEEIFVWSVNSFLLACEHCSYIFYFIDDTLYFFWILGYSYKRTIGIIYCKMLSILKKSKFCINSNFPSIYFKQSSLIILAWLTNSNTLYSIWSIQWLAILILDSSIIRYSDAPIHDNRFGLIILPLALSSTKMSVLCFLLLTTVRFYFSIFFV